MTYFSRRNNYQIEYSGYEDASDALRARLSEAIGKYVKNYADGYGDRKPSFIRPAIFLYAVQREFPRQDPFLLMQSGSFDQVFTVVEIFLDGIENIERSRRNGAIVEICTAFHLSGSVYQVNIEEKRIELVPSKELAESIKQTEEVLQSCITAHKTFCEAVGNLFGRKAKAGDVVRDIYVAAEEYLKMITREAQYSNAIKKLEKSGAINNEQKAVMEKLYAFRSNTQGTTHAGSSPEVSEKQALWYLDTMAAQLRNIDIQTKEMTI